MFSHVGRVRKKYPLAEAELDDETKGQPDEWVIVSERGEKAVVVGRGKSMPDAWADADQKLGRRRRHVLKESNTGRRRKPRRTPSVRSDR